MDADNIYFDFRLSLWRITDIKFVTGSLHRINVSDISHVSEVHAASIFTVEKETVYTSETSQTSL
jgi:hypothetical protein